MSTPPRAAEYGAKFAFSLPEDHATELHNLADQEDRTVSALLRIAVREYLERRGVIKTMDRSA